MVGRRRDKSIDQLDAAAKELARSHPEYDIRIRRRPSRRDHVVVWLLGTVFAALFPLIATAIHEIDGHRRPGIYELLGGGDLLLIALVVSIAAFGDFALVVRRTKDGNDLLISLLMIAEAFLIAGTGIWYGDLSSQVLAGTAGNPSGTIVWGSIGIYVFAGLLGCFCISIAAGVE